MADQFRTPMQVRIADCDAQGHLTGAAYLSYANHALWACLKAAGVDVDALIRDGFGPVHLETKISFLREFRCGDVLDVTCDLASEGGKTYKIRSRFLGADGHNHAEVESICGLLELKTRRLHTDPAAQWRQRAGRPELLGL